MPILPHKGKVPQVSKALFIADNAYIIGDVELDEGASVWYGAVLRGDIHRIQVGKFSNVQDNAVIHVTKDRWPTIIGDRVTVGHLAMLHGCVVEDDVLIGIGSIILDGAVVGRESVVAAGALVPPGMKIPPGSVVMGVPAKVVRKVTDKDLELIEYSWKAYVEHAKEAKESLGR